MRWRRRNAGMAIGVVLLAGPVAPTEPVPVGTVSVNPSHGRPEATVNAAYHLPKCPLSRAATFFWDGKLVSTAGFTPVDGGCVASTHFAPLVIDRAPGDHKVSASAGQLGGGPSTTYTIEPVGSPSPSTSPSPSRSPSASPTPSRTRATPSAVPTTEDALPVPDATDSSAAGPAPGTPGVTPHPAGAARSNPLTAWVMVGGGALMLGGVLIIGLLIYQDRRHRIADDGTQTNLGSLLSEAPTVEQPRLTES